MCLWYRRAAREWAVCHLAANAAAVPGRPAKQMDPKSTNDNTECPWHLYTCFYKSSQPVPEVQPCKHWRSGTTMFPLNLHIGGSQRVILVTFIQLEMAFISGDNNLYVAPNIWLHMFGWTFGSVALFQPPSPRRQVDVSAFSCSVTWWRTRAAAVELLLRVIIRAKRAGFHETAGVSMGLSRDARQDRPVTLRLGSGSPRVQLRTLGRPVQTSTADLNWAFSLQLLLYSKRSKCVEQTKKKTLFFQINA